MQATEALKLALGIGKPLIGKFYVYDALNGYTHMLTVDRNPECPLCGESPTIRSLSAAVVEQDGEGVCGLQ